ncbi:MAG: hypothetical protein AAB300_02955 [Nitrospirota bacterium]
MKRQIKLLGSGFFLVAALSGCGDRLDTAIEALGINGVNPQDPSAAFEKPFETLGTTDEAAGFGDMDMGLLEDEEVILAKASHLAAASDGIIRIATTTPVDPAPVDPNCLDRDTVFLKIRWGQLEVRDRVATGTDPLLVDPSRIWTNWSGSLTASHGRLTLVRPILFEKNGEEAPGPDEIIEERDPKAIEFVSYTKPHFDGLLVKYQHCRLPIATSTDLVATDDVADSARTITFTAADAPFRKVWTVEALKKLHETYPVDNVNKDTFQIAALHRIDLCRYGKGTMYGMWFKVNERFGQIKGRVVSSDGVAVGHIKGFYSVADENGVHKMVAKLVGKHGGFLGVVIGKAKDGKFEADIFKSREDKDGGVKTGTISGEYSEGGKATDDRRHKGKFSAVYELKELCDRTDPANDPAAGAVAPMVAQ